MPAVDSGTAPGPTRDLEAARNAYDMGDADASRAAHTIGLTKKPAAKEDHGGAGSDYIKSIVFGGLDGIITTFAIVAAVAGAGLSVEVVIMMGFSNLVADAISMGVGDFLSSKAEQDFIFAERRREAWEFENFPEGERQEMIELYVGKGFKQADAETIINTMGQEQYKEFFIDHMMVQELNLMVPDADDNPAKDGFVTFLSFMAFGSVPMWFYVIFRIADWHSKGSQFAVACVATAFTLFCLGVFKAKITRQPRLKQGLLMLVNGVLAAAAAYLIGYALEELLDASQNCSD